VINSSRSERGWQGRRRIAVLVSIAGVMGVAALASATSASAATVANCNAKLEPKGGSSAKLSFVCDGPVRSYTVGSNKRIKNYSAPSAGAAAAFLSCEGTGVGFGCGVPDRAAPGTQTAGTTGWTVVPPYPAGGSKATATPTTCNGFKRVDGDLGQAGPFKPNLTAIVTGACTQQIAPGTKVTQTIKLGSNPCAGGKDPVQLFLMVGGEPAVTSFIAPNAQGGGGESTTVGEYLQAPIPVNMKAFKGCQSSGGGAKKSATKAAAPATKYPVSCSGSISRSTIADQDQLSFTCTQNIRAFAIYSNKPIDLPGDEPVVTGTNGGGLNESAVHQCEGSIPGSGYGCGTVDRQAQTAPPPAGTGLVNGNGISAGNLATQKMGFEQSPCKRAGQPKTKAWLVVMGEPVIGSTVGEFSSQPFQLAITGYGKCKGGKKKK
jgi:hypothetical protein